MLDRQDRGLAGLSRLRDFAKTGTAERCDLCGRELAADHRHLLEPASRRLLCACGDCAVLFATGVAQRYKPVPRRIVLLDHFQLTDAQWDGLRLPINLAFFFRSAPESRMVACYPSPAGATESLLPLDAWQEIVAANPHLGDMEADVEALLVNRVGYARDAAPAGYFLVPIDQCYRLVGLIRTQWRGLSGGNDVWRTIAGFFADLRAGPHSPEARHA